MALVFFTFLAIFLLLGSAGLLIFVRGGMTQRLSAVLSPQTQNQSLLGRLKLGRAGSSFKAAVLPLEKLLPKSTQEVSVVRQRLTRAGYRDDSDLRIFYGAKVLVPLLLCVLAGVSGASQIGPFFVYTLALALGYLAPDFWLGRRIAARQLELRIGLPDFLDLMVVCIEAGLSLDQAMARSTEELHTTVPHIADEMGLVQLEQRAGRPRLDAWKGLADRTDIEVIRTLVSSIVQAEQFGTSIAKTLRTYSDSLRTQRRQHVEELAAKMAVKLVFPLVLFIFPSLFVVALGPAAIQMQDMFQKYFQ
jgi:tight adherence protein C